MGFLNDFTREAGVAGHHNVFWFSMVLIGVYVIAVRIGEARMRNRPPYGLRALLAIWSTLLAVFSIMGAIRTVPVTYKALTEKGLVYTVCSNEIQRKDKTFALWLWLFAMSKIPELFDTVFIVLRKQKLIFLHWYHHATVLYMVMHLYPADLGFPGFHFSPANFLVHAFMYSYYALRAFKIPVPRFVNQLITFMQIVQMVWGLFVSYTAWRLLQTGEGGEECRGLAAERTGINMSMIVYLSYLILFVNFFLHTYVFGGGSSKPPPHQTGLPDVKIDRKNV